MGRFDGYREILKDFRTELEGLTNKQNNEFNNAKTKFKTEVLQGEMKNISAEYAPLMQASRQRALARLDDMSNSMKTRNSGKFLPGFINTNLLEKMNIIADANISLTESELKDLATEALKSKSDFCCRKLLDIAEKSNYKMTLPNEFTANQVIEQTHARTKAVIEKYDGTRMHNNHTSGDMTSIKMSVDGRFLDELERKYESSTVEDISITRVPVHEYYKKKQENAEDGIEVIEAGDSLGISTTPIKKSSAAAQFAKAYSEKMQEYEPNPEFE